MERNVLILGTAHLATTPGKCSPDGRLSEAVWSREVCEWLAPLFLDAGYLVFIDYPDLQPNLQMRADHWKTEQSRELKWRVSFVNNICKVYGRERCLYVSVHCNASPPNDGRWHEASGFSVYVSRKASETSRKVAAKIWEKALEGDLKGNRAVPGCRYLEADFYVLRHTDCPAVLCECLFQDNRRDVEYLLSLMGKGAISRAIFRGADEVIRGEKTTGK